MRKRIGQIARGKFEYKQPILRFSEEQLEIRAFTDVDASGSFTLSGKDTDDLRGIIYSTCDRMECLTPQFLGSSSVIRYRFRSHGMMEGDTCEGVFVAVANGCVRELPYRVTVSNRYPECSNGEVKNLYDFTQLARENWEEAYKLFYQKNFKTLIKPKEVKEAMIYRGILAAKPSHQNMEEFLIGIRKKQRVILHTDTEHLEFSDVREERRESIALTKEGWGYFSVKVSSDAAFLKPETEQLHQENFVGNSCELTCRILPEELHEGKNFGRLILEDFYSHLEIIVTVDNSFGKKRDTRRRQVQEYKVALMELYQAYRLKRIVTGVWVNETVDILDHLLEIEPEEAIYGLMKAQAFIINRQRQEAEWLLDEFRAAWGDKSAPIWGYYLYLLTLMEREPAYVDKMTREIEALQRENPDSVLLFWVLSFLEEQYYNNSAQKLRAIERWVLDGNVSPYLYIEAYYLFCQDPYLLNSLGTFEIRILRWAIRNQALNRDLAMQIFSIVDTGSDFSETIYRLLCASYEVMPTPEHVGMICSYLIKGQKMTPGFHKWFEKGIELELRITNLYEAYLLSMDEHEISNVPKIIQMYFQYENRLPYKKMAVLYNNIIASKKKSPEIYDKYSETMGKFAMEQVERERIDDNLAVLYTEMLDLGLVNEEIAHHLANILFTKRIVVFDDRMVRVCVYQCQTREPQIVPVIDHAAYIQLYSREYVVLFEDVQGRRYVGNTNYQVQNLMDPVPYLEKCMNLAPEELPYIIWRFDTRQNYLNFSQEDEKFFDRIIYSKSLSDEYRGQMIPEILRYYHIHPYRMKDQSPETSHKPSMADYLNEADPAYMTPEARKFFGEMLVEFGLFEQAWALVREYGTDLLRAASREKLAVSVIENFGMDEDEFLTKLAYSSFCERRQEKVIVSYLCRFYSGPTDRMLEVWNGARKLAGQEEFEAMELEERILSQTLFSGEFYEDIRPLFEHFYAKGGQDILVLAYITTRADAYFLHDNDQEEDIIEWIKARYLAKDKLNDSCKLALLKAIASKGNSGGEEYRIADELLSEFTSRSMVFGFYKKLNRSLIQKYHLYDKVILEYRTNPQNRVTIHYSRDEDGTEFIAEDMIDVYNGIFVKQFVMFFGEIIQYYFSEEQNGQVKMSQSNRLANHDVYNQKDESRYSLINQMLMSNTLREEESMKRYMLRYQELDEMTAGLFHTL